MTEPKIAPSPENEGNVPSTFTQTSENPLIPREGQNPAKEQITAPIKREQSHERAKKLTRLRNFSYATIAIGIVVTFFGVKQYDKLSSIFRQFLTQASETSPEDFTITPEMEDPLSKILLSPTLPPTTTPESTSTPKPPTETPTPPETQKTNPYALKNTIYKDTGLSYQHPRDIETFVNLEEMSVSLIFTGESPYFQFYDTAPESEGDIIYGIIKAHDIGGNRKLVNLPIISVETSNGPIYYTRYAISDTPEDTFTGFEIPNPNAPSDNAPQVTILRKVSAGANGSQKVGQSQNRDDNSNLQEYVYYLVDMDIAEKVTEKDPDYLPDIELQTPATEPTSYFQPDLNDRIIKAHAALNQLYPNS